MRLRTVLFVTGLVICLVSFGFAFSEAAAGPGQGVEAASSIICSMRRSTIAPVWLVTTKKALVWNWTAAKHCH